MRIHIASHRAGVFAVAALCVAALSACGSSSSTSSSTGGAAPTGTSASATETTASATETTGGSGGIAQYADEVPKGKNPAVGGTKTIGLISACESCEALPRMADGFRDAADALGWKVRVYDTQGDVSKAEQGAETLMQAGVDAIVLESVEPATLGAATAKAKAKGIPIVGSLTGLTVAESKGVLDAGVEQPLVEEGQQLGDRIVEQVGEGGKVALINDKLLAVGRNPEIGLRKALEGKADIVATHQADFTKLAADAYDTTQKWLVQYPDLKAIWCTFDGACIGASEAVQAAGSDVVIYGINGNKGPLEAMRKGANYVTDATPIEYGAWLATDKINSLLAKRELEPDGVVRGQIVDKENVPASGLVDGTTLYGDFREAFRNRWGV